MTNKNENEIIEVLNCDLRALLTIIDNDVIRSPGDLTFNNGRLSALYFLGLISKECYFSTIESAMDTVYGPKIESSSFCQGEDNYDSE